MTHPELTTANTSETFDTLICVVNKDGLPGLLVGRVPESHSIATRLVACWNACLEMDDPVAEITKLREGNQSLLQALSEADKQAPDIARLHAEIDRLNNLVAERGRTIARLEEHIERMEEHIETEAQIAAGVHGPVRAEPTPEHLAYQLLRSLILSSDKPAAQNPPTEPIPGTAAALAKLTISGG